MSQERPSRLPSRIPQPARQKPADSADVPIRPSGIPKPRKPLHSISGNLSAEPLGIRKEPWKRKTAGPAVSTASAASAAGLLKESIHNAEKEYQLLLDDLHDKRQLNKNTIAHLAARLMDLETQKSQDSFSALQLEDKLHKLRRDVKSVAGDISRAPEALNAEKEKLRLAGCEVRHTELLRHQTELQELRDAHKRSVEAKHSARLEAQKCELEELRKAIKQAQNRIVEFRTETQKARDVIVEQYSQSVAEEQRKFTETRLTQTAAKEAAITDKETTEMEISAVESETEKYKQELRHINDELESGRESAEAAESITKTLFLKTQQLQEEIRSTELSRTAKSEFLRSFTEHLPVMRQELATVETQRRKLHNIVQTLKGNIRVFCRIRPLLGTETDMTTPLTTSFPSQPGPDGQQTLTIAGPASDGGRNLGLSSQTQRSHTFKFDRVFGPCSTNAEVFAEISQLVQCALDGSNVCIFAYGQTGSGKTYTMSEADGMIPRAVRQIFAASEELKTRGWQYNVTGQFLEIYNESIRDLLAIPGNSATPNSNRLEIRHDIKTQTTNVTGLTSVSLSNPNSAAELLAQANRNRSVGATQANERSSRSHSVFTLRLTGNNSETEETCAGTLHLVDLAGSERLSSSQATGNRLRETQAINRSLSCLGDVICALNSKDSSHIPYRNSKLTYLLQYSLGGDSKTLMFVNISPLEQHFNETVNSLRFAAMVNSTKVGGKGEG